MVPCIIVCCFQQKKKEIRKLNKSNNGYYFHKQMTAAYSLSIIASHKVVHGWGHLRSKRELVLNVEIAGKLLDNVSLGTIKDIVGQESV
jgi:membrane-anchored protein YejM (alkaline phosphatase superfamily)